MLSKRPRTLLPVLLSVVALGAGLALPTSAALAASAPGTAQSALPSAVPAASTPQVTDGTVFTFAQSGGTMIAGGNFTKVQNYARTTSYSRADVFAFDAVTGAVSTAFAPTLNGEVDATLAGPKAGTVYVAGTFTTWNGASVPGLVLADVNTGKLVPGFAPPAIPRGVNTLRSTGSQLIIGGSFTKVGTSARGGLASLDPGTGALTGFLTTGVAGHHNYGNVSAAELAAAPFPGATVPQGRTGVQKLAINPQNTRMVVIGNFDTIGGLHRDQIAVFNLNSTAATLDTGWASSAYSAPCFWFTFDGYLRDVDFSPDGSYFAVAAAGGHDFLIPEKDVRCDTITRYETSAEGSDVQPTWVQSSGSDSFFSVAVTGTAVYGGGHPRWANNPLNSDASGGGAVARPSFMALDPVNGLPFAYNPGREPRGVGIQAILATSTGLWLGYDTDWMGNLKYRRQRIAFMPLAGGYTPAAATTATLPAAVYLPGSGATDLAARTFDGTTAGPSTVVGSPLTWSTVHGATVIGGKLFYWSTTDQQLHARTFAAGTLGPDAVLNPYSDPVWDNVNDSGRNVGQVMPLKGIQPDFYGRIADVTSAAFAPATHRLYYTLSGDSALYYREFSPDSGVLFPIARIVPGVSMSGVDGLIISGSSLWFSNSGTGTLSRIGLTAGGVTGSASPVSGPAIDGISWRAGIEFTSAS